MNLRNRLTIIYAISAIFIIFGTVFTLIFDLFYSLKNDFDEKLEKLAVVISDLDLPRNSNSATWLEKIENLEKSSEISIYFQLKDKKYVNFLKTESDFELISKRLVNKKIEIPIFYSLKEIDFSDLVKIIIFNQKIIERRAIIFPIQSQKNDTNTAAILIVVASNFELGQILSKFRSASVFWGIVGVILAFMVSYLIASFISQPIQQIIHAAKSIEQGLLTTRIPNDQGSDEIAKLKRQLNSMLERLEILVESQRRFTADAAHDLRTPLAIIRGELELALYKTRPNQEYKEVLARILTEVKSFMNLTEDLLLLTRLEVGIDQPKKMMNLNEILEPSLANFSFVAQQKGVLVRLNIPKKLELYGHSYSISRAISNLLSNALTHGFPNLPNSPLPENSPEIGISALQTDQKIQIKVFDSGAGINHPEPKQLFNRFAKGRFSEGSGLGLAIVLEIVQQHEGTIQIEPRQGGGTVFILEFPRIDT
jgi:signal transduction histidine kinase